MRHDITGNARQPPGELQTGRGAVLQKAPPRHARAGSCASWAAVSRVSGAEARGLGSGQPRPSGRPRPQSRPAPPVPRWRVRARRKASAVGESHFQTAGSVHNWAGKRRMEVGLSAITVYLASTGSPVAATTMDRESVNRAEGEAVSASGAAAAAAFRESERQVGEAATEAGRAQPSLCLVSQLPFWPVGLPPRRPPAGGAFRGSSSVSPPLLRHRLGERDPSLTPLLAAPQTLRRPQVST